MDDLNKLKVTDLKAELKKRGLGVSGVKAVLVERLQEAIDKENEPSTPAVDDDASKVATESNGEDVPAITDTVDADGPVADESRGEPAQVEEMDDDAEKEITPPEEANVVTPPKSPVTEMKVDEHNQPSITEFIPVETQEVTVAVAPLSPSPPPTTAPPPKVAEPGQQMIEETIQNDVDTRKRKHPEDTPVVEPPLSPSKRAKKLSPPPRSRTPEPTPHRAVAANQTLSLHPPTSAIYITCLSRPLSLPAFLNHLTSLTTSHTPPIQVWLNAIKSHGFVVFGSEDDASVVRDALNGVAWPTNENRRPLCVDYVPRESVSDYIDSEESSRGQRFEVVYIKSSDGIITARHRPAESKETLPVRLIEGQSDRSSENVIPTGPRAARREEPPAKGKDNVEVRGGEKVRVLRPDELFRKTVTKPWVYWAENKGRERSVK
jgi:hypothetical protein